MCSPNFCLHFQSLFPLAAVAWITLQRFPSPLAFILKFPVHARARGGVWRGSVGASVRGLLLTVRAVRTFADRLDDQLLDALYHVSEARRSENQSVNMWLHSRLNISVSTETRKMDSVGKNTQKKKLWLCGLLWWSLLVHLASGGNNCNFSDFIQLKRQRYIYLMMRSVAGCFNLSLVKFEELFRCL